MTKRNDTLLYRTINELRKWLVEKRFAPNTRLPSIRDLAFEHKVSRITISNALNQLIADGILRSENRQGIFVVSPPKSPLVLDAYMPLSWRETLLNYDVTHHSYYIYRQFLDGIIRGSSEHDVAVTIEYVASYDYETVRSARQSLMRDCAVFFHYGDQKFFNELRKRNEPYAHVFLGEAVENNQIGVRHNACSKWLQQRLDEGIENFAFLSFSPFKEGGEDKNLLMVLKRLKQLKIDLKPEWFYRYERSADKELLRGNARKYLSELKKLPELIISSSSFQTRHFLRAAESMNVDLREIPFLIIDSPLGFNEPEYDVNFSDPRLQLLALKAVECLKNIVDEKTYRFDAYNVESILVPQNNNGVEK